MVTRARVALYAAFLTIAVGSGAFAQTSSVALAPLAPFAPDAAPLPTKPLEILDSDYPLESLILNEEGQTVLNLVLSNAGAVRVAQIIGSSGSAVLDGRAAQVARTRWSFQPVMKNGAPIAAEVKAAVTWKLPLAPRDEYAMDAPGPTRTSRVVPPVPRAANRILPDEYPMFSARAGEEGQVILKSAIDETGKVTDVQLIASSGYPRLDQVAINAVRRRFAYEPATLDGRPIASTFTTFVEFFILPPRSAPFRFRLYCHEKPVFSTFDRDPTRESGGPRISTRWLLTRDGSQIDDALLLTNQGWLHVATSALTQMTFPENFRLVRGGPVGQPCWVHVSGPIPF